MSTWPNSYNYQIQLKNYKMYGQTTQNYSEFPQNMNRIISNNISQNTENYYQQSQPYNYISDLSMDNFIQPFDEDNIEVNNPYFQDQENKMSSAFQQNQQFTKDESSNAYTKYSNSNDQMNAIYLKFSDDQYNNQLTQNQDEAELRNINYQFFNDKINIAQTTMNKNSHLYTMEALKNSYQQLNNSDNNTPQIKQESGVSNKQQNNNQIFSFQDKQLSIVRSQIAKQRRSEKKQEKLNLIKQQYLSYPKRDLRSNSKQIENQILKSNKKSFGNQSNFGKTNQKENNLIQFQVQQPQENQINYDELTNKKNLQIINNDINFNSSYYQYDQLNNCNNDCFHLTDLQEESQQQSSLNDQQNSIQTEGLNKIETQSCLEEEKLSSSIEFNFNKKNIVKNIMSSFQRFILSTFQDQNKSKEKIQKSYLFQKSKLSVYLNPDQMKQKDELTQIIQNDIFKLYNNNKNDNPTQEKSEEFIHKFKRYFQNRSFNNFTVKLLIKHKTLGPIFKYYLDHFLKNWLFNLNVNKIQSHLQMSDILQKSFSDDTLLNKISTHKK